MNRKEKKKFHKELGEFVTTALILGFINYMTSSYPWFLWAVGIWGASLVGKYIQYQMDDELEDHEDDYLDLKDHPRYEKETMDWREKDMV